MCHLCIILCDKVIHGDLAARNVLVFNSNIVKIADFGMSKHLYGSGKYKMKKQVRITEGCRKSCTDRPPKMAYKIAALAISCNRKNYHGDGHQLSF